MAGLPTGGSQVFSERARKSFMYHALSKPVGDDSQTMSSRGRGIDRYAEQSSSGATCWRGGGLRSRNTTLLLHDRLAAVTLISLQGDREETDTMTRHRSELQPAQTPPLRWQAILGPAVAGLGMLLLIGWALSA